MPCIYFKILMQCFVEEMSDLFAKLVLGDYRRQNTFFQVVNFLSQTKTRFPQPNLEAVNMFMNMFISMFTNVNNVYQSIVNIAEIRALTHFQCDLEGALYELFGLFLFCCCCCCCLGHAFCLISPSILNRFQKFWSHQKELMMAKHFAPKFNGFD